MGPGAAGGGQRAQRKWQSAEGKEQETASSRRIAVGRSCGAAIRVAQSSVLFTKHKVSTRGLLSVVL